MSLNKALGDALLWWMENAHCGDSISSAHHHARVLIEHGVWAVDGPEIVAIEPLQSMVFDHGKEFAERWRKYRSGLN